MAAGRPYLQWEIWDVYWIHEDGTGKRRPALLISMDQENETRKDLAFLKISSQFRNSRFRYEMMVSDPEFAVTGLKKSSYLYADQLQRIAKGNVLTRRGYVGVSMGKSMLPLIRQAFAEAQRTQGGSPAAP